MLGALFTSCDMDQIPEGTTGIDDITNYTDLFELLNQVYSGLRGATAGSYIAIPDIQADQFNGSVDNGNRYGTIANKLFTSNDSDLEALFNACYSRISHTNFFLQKADSLLEVNEAALEAGTTPKFSADELIEIERYIGEAKFARAYAYFYLFDHWCQHYTADKAETPALGLPLVKTFAPSKDQATYPGRSTMKATLEFINKDLEDAFQALDTYETTYSADNAGPNAIYLNSFTVAAMQARVALYTEQWQTARDKAAYVTETGIFPLVTTEAAYTAMWATDNASELLFVPFASSGEQYASSVWNFYNNLQAGNSVDYAPAPEIYLSYYYQNDIRESNNVRLNAMLIQGNYVAGPRFTKWEGNNSLEGNRLNRPHPFRSAEMYLTLAEAEYMLGNTDEARAALNDLIIARAKVKYSDTLAGEQLLTAIKSERATELLGEGFRLSDLKRWGEGFTRNVDYSAYDNGLKNTVAFGSLMSSIGADVKYAPNDDRYTWPIPAAEMDINPQLAGQQNPGY